MLSPQSLKNLLQKPGYSRSEKMMLCLAVEPGEARAVKDVRAMAINAGLRQAQRWNISRILAEAGSDAARTREGWELTDDGWIKVGELAGTALNRRATRVAAGLRHHVGALQSPEAKSFVTEAVACLEPGLYRAAVVLSWVGAVSVLQDAVVAGRLDVFNAEALRRDPKWKTAKSRDDLSRMKEADFLHVLAAISMIGKSVKQELEAALRLRNGCGHPNSLLVGEARTAAHVESLILNVFSKF